MDDSAGFGDPKGYYVYFELSDDYNGKPFKITGTKENSYDGNDLKMLFRISNRKTETVLKITADGLPTITLNFKKATFKPAEAAG